MATQKCPVKISATLEKWKWEKVSNCKWKHEDWVTLNYKTIFCTWIEAVIIQMTWGE